MVKRIYSPTDLEMEFKRQDRDYFSYEGYQTILEYEDSIDEDEELDVITLCSEWTEYGPEVDGNYDNFIMDNGYAYNIEDWVRDTYPEYEDADEDEIMMAIENGDIDTEDYPDALADAVADDVLELFKLGNGDFLIAGI